MTVVAATQKAKDQEEERRQLEEEVENRQRTEESMEINKDMEEEEFPRGDAQEGTTKE